MHTNLTKYVWSRQWLSHLLHTNITKYVWSRQWLSHLMHTNFTKYVWSRQWLSHLMHTNHKKHVWPRQCQSRLMHTNHTKHGLYTIDVWENAKSRLLGYCTVLGCKVKGKGLPQQAEVAQGVPGGLRPRIFLAFRHYKGGRSSAICTSHLYPRRNRWYSFSEAESTSGHMVCRGTHGKNPQWHHRESIPGLSD